MHSKATIKILALAMIVLLWAASTQTMYASDPASTQAMDDNIAPASGAASTQAMDNTARASDAAPTQAIDNTSNSSAPDPEAISEQTVQDDTREIDTPDNMLVKAQKIVSDVQGQQLDTETFENILASLKQLQTSICVNGDNETQRAVASVINQFTDEHIASHLNNIKDEDEYKAEEPQPTQGAAPVNDGQPIHTANTNDSNKWPIIGVSVLMGVGAAAIGYCWWHSRYPTSTASTAAHTSPNPSTLPPEKKPTVTSSSTPPKPATPAPPEKKPTDTSSKQPTKTLQHVEDKENKEDNLKLVIFFIWFILGILCFGLWATRKHRKP